jgi:hypothetical protein
MKILNKLAMGGCALITLFFIYVIYLEIIFIVEMGRW